MVRDSINEARRALMIFENRLRDGDPLAVLARGGARWTTVPAKRRQRAHLRLICPDGGGRTMRFGRPDPRNPSEDLSELNAKIVTNEDGTASLHVHLTMGHAELPLEGRDFRVGVVEAVLRVECEGVEIDPWSRLYQNERSKPLSSTVTNEAIAKSHSTASGSFDFGVSADASKVAASGSAAAKFGGGSETQVTKTLVSTQEVQVLNVVALGGNRWRIREPEGTGALTGSFFGREALCTLSSVGGSNRQRIHLTLEVRQKDLVFEPKPNTIFGRATGSRNEEKLKAILVTKCLHKEIGSERSFAGKLLLSVVECSVEPAEPGDDNGL